MSLPKPIIGAIIQARLTSKRLPRKHLLQINGKPLLEHLVNRVQSSYLINKVVIAAPHSPECCLDVDTYIGSENDVLDRYYQTAKKYNFDIIVRLTADCPFVPVSEINRVVERYLEGDTHYVTNVGARATRFGTPDGWDVECFSFDALQVAWEMSEDREHVTSYMKASLGFHPIFLEPVKLSVDTEEDFNRLVDFYFKEAQHYERERTQTAWTGLTRHS